MAESRQRVSINGFVLAGGLSSRMGRDKCFIDWRGKTLLQHMVHLLSTVAGPVRIIGREEFPDRYPNAGPLGGIATALGLCSSPIGIVVAVDLPLLTIEFLEQFRDRVAKSKSPLVAYRIGNRFPLCLGISTTLLPDVEGRLAAGRRNIYGWIGDSDAEILSGASESMFQNINTEADYQRALSEQ
jgi:molybdopterin-guanine dinucleotide biosynthesis protein A